MSSIVVLVGSPRKNGNTDILAKQFAKGAREHNDDKETGTDSCRSSYA